MSSGVIMSRDNARTCSRMYTGFGPVPLLGVLCSDLDVLVRVRSRSHGFSAALLLHGCRRPCIRTGARPSHTASSGTVWGTHLFDRVPTQNLPSSCCTATWPLQDVYSDPGSPLTRRTKWGTYILARVDGGDQLLMSGAGATPEGSRPFLDLMDISSKVRLLAWRAVKLSLT